MLYRGKYAGAYFGKQPPTPTSNADVRPPYFHVASIQILNVLNTSDSHRGGSVFSWEGSLTSAPPVTPSLSSLASPFPLAPPRSVLLPNIHIP
jgi:hypothetical protein